MGRGTDGARAALGIVRDMSTAPFAERRACPGWAVDVRPSWSRLGGSYSRARVCTRELATVDEREIGLCDACFNACRNCGGSGWDGGHSGSDGEAWGCGDCQPPSGYALDFRARGAGTGKVHDPWRQLARERTEAARLELDAAEQALGAARERVARARERAREAKRLSASVSSRRPAPRTVRSRSK